MIHEVYIIDNNTSELIENLKKTFKEESDEYNFKIIKTNEINVALRNILVLNFVEQ